MAEEKDGRNLTTTELARLLGFTSERVRQLEDEGIIKSISHAGRKHYKAIPNLVAYINHLREQVEGKASADILEDIAKQDYRYKKSRADKIELEVKELQGMMHRAEDVELITSDMIATIRAGILALPGRLAVDAAEARTAAEASAVIKEGVDDLLNNMSRYKYDPAEYRKRVRERAKWAAEEQVVEAEPAPEKKTAKKAPPKKTAKKAPAKRTAAGKTTAKKTVTKKVSSKRQPSSKTPAKASKRRKT